MADKIETFQIQFMKRNARQRGPTSSESFNDQMNEISVDLEQINSQWNERFVPLVSTLPNADQGLLDHYVDAFTNGLDGNTLYTKHDATSTVNSAYYNSTATRPYTVFEQFQDIYTTIATEVADLEATIEDKVQTASAVTISDDSNSIVATNVEDALQELVTKVDLALDNQEIFSVNSKTPTGTTETLDFDLATSYIINLESATGDVTLTLNNAAEGFTYTILVIQGSTTRNLNWPASVKWPGGTAPTITAANDSEDKIELWYNGTNFYGKFEQNYL